MADVELVIKIDEEVKMAIDNHYTPVENDIKIYDAIRNGTVLLKGHGRLIDVGKYEKEYFNVAIQYDDGNHIHSDYINTIPTIIEADKAESEDKE